MNSVHFQAKPQLVRMHNFGVYDLRLENSENQTILQKKLKVQLRQFLFKVFFFCPVVTSANTQHDHKEIKWKRFWSPRREQSFQHVQDIVVCLVV